MPLQNRIDPFGRIEAVAVRGQFTGNRGIIHDPETRTLLSRRWTTKAWIICALKHPRGLQRKPMGRNAPSGTTGWTELFFLDEATALAAGHRPCFYCRREVATLFLQFFVQANAIQETRAATMDAVLHRYRLAVLNATPTLTRKQIARLPDGAFITTDGKQAFAIKHGNALPWGFSGYGPARPIPAQARLVTPLPTVATLEAGYRPVWHESAHGT